jgi:hypothetical protein
MSDAIVFQNHAISISANQIQMNGAIILPQSVQSFAAKSKTRIIAWISLLFWIALFKFVAPSIEMPNYEQESRRIESYGKVYRFETPKQNEITRNTSKALLGGLLMAAVAVFKSFRKRAYIVTISSGLQVHQSASMDSADEANQVIHALTQVTRRNSS